MRYIEWLVLFVISGLGIALANFVGFDVGFMESLPGILVLLAIAAAGVAVSKVSPLKLPVVAYVSIIGLLAACPISPCRDFVIDAAAKINFTATLTMVGAYSGISIIDQILFKTGLEDDPGRHLCDARDVYRVCCHRPYRHDIDGNDLMPVLVFR